MLSSQLRRLTLLRSRTQCDLNLALRIMWGSEHRHVSFEFFDSGEHFVTFFALEALFYRFSGFCVGSVARERALGLKHNHAVPDELLHHRVDGSRERDTHALGGLLLL